MIRNICIPFLSVAAIGFAVSFAAPSTAHAGGIVTAHSLTLSLHSVDQSTTSKGDDKQDKVNVNQKSLYEVCTGAAPTKTQGVYLFLNNAGNCIAPPASLTVLAIDTAPLTNKGAVGTITLDTPMVQTTTSGGTVLKSIKVPAQLHIDCNGSTTTADLFGILNLNYGALTKGGPVCPLSGSMRLVGSANSTIPGDIIIDDGSSAKINKRSGSISTIP